MVSFSDKWDKEDKEFEKMLQEHKELVKKIWETYSQLSLY